MIGIVLLTSTTAFSGEVCQLSFLKDSNLQVVLSKDGEQLSHPEAFTERAIADLRELRAEGICK